MAGARVRCFPGKRAKTGRRTCKWKNHPGLMTASSPAVLGLPRCRRQGERREGRSRRKQAHFKSNAAWGAAVGTRSSSRPGWPRGRADLPRQQPPAGPFPGLFLGLRWRRSARARAAGQLPALPVPRLQGGGTEAGGRQVPGSGDAAPGSGAEGSLYRAGL